MKQLVGMPKTNKFKNPNKNHPTILMSRTLGLPQEPNTDDTEMCPRCDTISTDYASQHAL